MNEQMDRWIMENPETHRRALGRDKNGIIKLGFSLVDSDS